MDSQKVDLFLLTNAKNFEPHHIQLIRDKLVAMDESKWILVQSLSLNDPTTILIVSLVAGVLGIDRFMIGDTGLGVAKLLTCGGAAVWTIVDWFLIMGRTRELNLEKILRIL